MLQIENESRFEIGGGNCKKIRKEIGRRKREWVRGREGRR